MSLKWFFHIWCISNYSFQSLSIDLQNFFRLQGINLLSHSEFPTRTPLIYRQFILQLYVSIPTTYSTLPTNLFLFYNFPSQTLTNNRHLTLPNDSINSTLTASLSLARPMVSILAILYSHRTVIFGQLIKLTAPRWDR